MGHTRAPKAMAVKKSASSLTKSKSRYLRVLEGVRMGLAANEEATQ
jgi:hypothetical protein